jgi:hypothetical protein
MLEGIAANDIIVGAYSTGEGICPMLAAHRHGGRTSLIAFAEAWDCVAFRGQRQSRARRATERELLILRSHLEASLLEEGVPTLELAAAHRDHEALMARRDAAAARATHRPERPTDPAERPGDTDRARELRLRPGWAWTPVVRRYDEYASLIRRVDDARADAEQSEPALTR